MGYQGHLFLMSTVDVGLGGGAAEELVLGECRKMGCLGRKTWWCMRGLSSGHVWLQKSIEYWSVSYVSVLDERITQP